MSSRIAMISRPLTRSRGKKSSSAAPTITAANSWRPLLRKRRAQNRRAISRHIGAGGACTPRVRAALPSPSRTDSTTRFPVSSRTAFTNSSVRARRCWRRCSRASWRDAIRPNSLLREKAHFIAQGVLSGKIFELAKPGNVSLWKELSGHFARPEVKAMLARAMERVTEPERRTFLMANLVCEQLAFRLFEKFVKQLSSGNVIESMQALSGIAPILVVLAPYIYGFHSQAPSRKWLRRSFREMTGDVPRALQNRKRAWFTDTLEDVNGVATTIRKMTAAGARAGEELIVVTSRGDVQLDDIPIKNFRRSANSSCRNTSCRS